MLKLQDISVTFSPGTVNARTALDHVSLELREGDFVTVIGSNGAGKSTLMNVIAGNFLPDHGTITLDGQDVTFEPDYKRSRSIGRMFQDPLKGTAPHMTIEENLSLAFLRSGKKVSPFSRITGKDRAFFREELAKLNLGLEDRLDQPVGLLSGGQRQALTLLMATLVPPKLLLLDEHTAALDPATAEKVLSLTEQIVAKNHTTCLMITHHIPTALSMGNRTLMMDRGHIVLDIEGDTRKAQTSDTLLRLFREKVSQAELSDRILFGTI